MIIVPERKILVHSTIGMKGYFRLKCIRPNGRVRLDTGWFANTLLDSGRNYMATANFMTSCQVGTDNTAAAAAQTALLGYRAGTTTIQDTISGQQSSSTPYYAWKRKVFRFSAGTVAANLSEVGVGWGTSGSTLISRALILDPILQTPTTITPLIDEILDVTYELRYYPPTGDVTSPQVTLNSIVYDTVTRAAEANSQYWSDGIGNVIAPSAATGWLAYDGNIGTVLQNPSGTSSAASSGSTGASAYSNNSYELAIHISVPSVNWNLGSGIRSIRIRTSAGSFQTQFDSNPGGSTIPKSASFTMYMEWTLSWTEYT